MAKSRTDGTTRSNIHDSGAAPSSTQQIVSLLLILHLFCVCIALSSYTRRSALQNRVLALLAPYVRTINLAPAAAPYHLTQYDALTGDNEHDDEHFLELQITSADGQPEFHNLSESTIAFPDARRRYRSFASEMVYSLASAETGDNRLAELARSAGGFGLRQHGADAGVLRLRHHLSQPRLLSQLQSGFPPDPTAPQYIVTSYEADVLLDDGGEVQLIKREDRTQVAPPISKSSGAGDAAVPSPRKES